MLPPSSSRPGAIFALTDGTDFILYFNKFLVGRVLKYYYYLAY